MQYILFRKALLLLAMMSLIAGMAICAKCSAPSREETAGK